MIFITNLLAFQGIKDGTAAFNFKLATKPLIPIFADAKKNEYEAVTNGRYKNPVPEDKKRGG